MNNSWVDCRQAERDRDGMSDMSPLLVGHKSKKKLLKSTYNFLKVVAVSL